MAGGILAGDEMSKYGKIFNIRVPKDKQAIIDEYKELIKDKLHSDTCFVTTMLIESFVKAHRTLPEPTIIHLVKQDITINQNCTNIYGTALKRPRRLMPKDRLDSKALLNCEFCDLPATRRYLYPMHGYLDVCVNHYSKAIRSLGYKEVPSILATYDMTPTFPLKPQPKEKQHFFVKLWNSVKQLLAKLLRG